MKSIRVVISGVGSGIGQSIIDSCNLSKLELKTIGMDCNALAFGGFDCDIFVQTPEISEPTYMDSVLSLCREHAIDFYIPGLDTDLDVVSEYVSEFEKIGTRLIISSEAVIQCCRNKSNLMAGLEGFESSFVKTYDLKAFLEASQKDPISYPLIAKPNNGSGSQGIKILLTRDDVESLTDDYTVQEIALPAETDENYKEIIAALSKRENSQLSEISIQIVTDKSGHILGKMASKNRLKNGVPVEIIPIDKEVIWETIDPLVDKLIEMGHRGPLNFQGRINESGLKLFEMNARFTGISGLRAQLGFNEVDACLRSWMNEPTAASLRVNPGKIGLRQTLARTVGIHSFPNINGQMRQVAGKPVQVRSLLITGGTGYVGQNLIRNLQEQAKNYHIHLITQNLETAEELFSDEIKLSSWRDFINGELNLGQFDMLLHLGFARPHRTDTEIALSLKRTALLFEAAVSHQISRIVNVSSQSVYGLSQPPPWNETQPAAPESTYAMAKLSSELILEKLCASKPHINHTSLRLATVCGAAPGLIGLDLMSRFVKQYKMGEPIKVIGGQQQFERIDIRDAISAISTLVTEGHTNWQGVYNLGVDYTFSCLELAQTVMRIGNSHYPQSNSKLIVEAAEVDMKFGMNSSAFRSLSTWEPQFNLEDSVNSLFNYDF